METDTFGMGVPVLSVIFPRTVVSAVMLPALFFPLTETGVSALESGEKQRSKMEKDRQNKEKNTGLMPLYPGVTVGVADLRPFMDLLIAVLLIIGALPRERTFPNKLLNFSIAGHHYSINYGTISLL
jgi:hypothetical protein